MPGQKVIVPTRAVALAARDVPNPAIELYGLVNGRHVVRKGETLSGLAVKYHTTVKHIMALNHLKRDMIFIGQTLRITGSVRRESSASARKGSRKSSSGR